MRIYTNQVGYFKDARKIAAVTEGCEFEVINAGSGKVAFSGRSSDAVYDEAAGEKVYRIDFSDLREDGKYYIQSGDKARSHTFEISDKPYRQLHIDLLKVFYYQRCGCALESKYAGKYTHAACHTDRAIFLEDYMNKTEAPESFDMTGGWHDAGDFGRYSTAASVALAHLLYAYELFPESFGDSLNIPESGNDMPDVLNECMYELSWLVKMQAEDGGVYHKLTAFCHAPFIMPEEDKDTFLIFPVSSMAVADFAAVMALASRVYRKYRPEFAEDALKRAKKSWEWLTKNGYVGFKNPQGSNTGEYDDVCDADERFWAACELMRTDTANSAEYAEAAKLYAGKVSKLDFGWTDVSALGSMAIMTDRSGACPEELRKEVSAVVLEAADSLMKIQNCSGYPVAMKPEDYVWGSNMVVCNRGMLFILAALNSDGDTAKAYLQAARFQLDYLLGTNALDYSYVTGHGEHAYKNPHNRPTACDGIDEPMPGWVSGGPFKTPCDEAAVELIEKGTAPMKCYVDHVGSYSTNEITIYWNSPAVFITACLTSEK